MTLLRLTRTIQAVSFAIATALVALPQAQASIYSSAVLADNPLGYWRLDETSGTTALNLGSTGATSNGTYTGGVTQGVPGATLDGNSAASFDGSNDFVLLPDAWGGTSAGTIEAWVNVDSSTTGVFRAIVSSTSTNYAHFQLYSPSGGSTGFYNGGFPAAPPLTPLGEWHHVALVADATSTLVYVDGAVFSSGGGIAGTIALSLAGEVAIGRGFGGGRLFSGGIDEVAIYDTALTQAQILAHIEAAATPPVPEPSTLALLGLGVFGLALRARRRRTAA